MAGKTSKRRIVVLRHGERLDFSFGKTWIREDYVRTDLNMPEKLPQRQLDHWLHDTPLTKLGVFQSELVGASFRDSGVKFSKVFVSPSYRCLQTATEVLRGMGIDKELQLNVEYGQFEWIDYYGNDPPIWLSDKEYREHFNVNESYEAIISRTEFQNIKTETFQEFCDRNSRVTKEILDKYEGDILIVGHASNLDLCTRQLLGSQSRPRPEFRQVLITVPYLGAIAMEQTGDSFKLIDPPCLTLTHDLSSKFDWKTFEGNFEKDPNAESVMDSRNNAIASYLANVKNIK